MIPISLAFFYRDSAEGRVGAMYPSPAGTIESLLSLESWSEIAAEHPALQKMEADVETFLVNRVGTPAQYYIVPVDECYRLVGLSPHALARLSGGTEVWKEIHNFFADLKNRSVEVERTGPCLSCISKSKLPRPYPMLPLAPVALKLRVTNLPAEEAIHTLTLRCRVQIEPAKRRCIPRSRRNNHDLAWHTGAMEPHGAAACCG